MVNQISFGGHRELARECEANHRVNEKAKQYNKEEIKGAAFAEGYDKVAKDYEIWYYCAVCTGRIDMEPNGNGRLYEGIWMRAYKLSSTVER